MIDNVHPLADPSLPVIFAPTLRQIQDYASTALLCCPNRIQKVIHDTEITVENYAPSEVLQELKVKNRNELLGLYKIHPEDGGRTLTLYRAPLILYAQSSNEFISSVVARVTIYEISHRTNCLSLRKQWLDKMRKL